MSKWPYDLIFSQPRPDILKQEMVTYRKVGDKIVKETVERRFYGKADYQDSTTSEIIYAPK